MGMFDHIRAEVQLPGLSEVTKELFQTKSLSCTMASYVITANHELYIEEWDYRYDENDKPEIPPEGQTLDSLLEYLRNSRIRVEGSYRRTYLTDFHGDIIFYNDDFNPYGIWREYCARFTEGRLSRIWYTDINI